MAVKIFPSREEIENFKTPLNNGEKYFGDRLYSILQNIENRFFELHIQPNINGDRPDIVVIEKATPCSLGGVWIAEVKDWNLSSYNIPDTDSSVWSLKKDPKQSIRSPFKQVEQYKENLFNKHSIELGFKLALVKSNSAFNIVRTAVCFTDQAAIKPKDRNFKHTYCFTQNNTDDDFLEFFTPHRSKNKLTDDMFSDIAQYLAPIEADQERLAFSFDREQQHILNAEQRRIKFVGVAGSGKTEILCSRVAKCLNGGESVLVLTFNKTLRNYLRDRIRKSICRSVQNDELTISHYHQYFRLEANNTNSDKPLLSDYDNPTFFEGKSTKRYDAIFIDEIQDYKENWIRLVDNSFLVENGLFFICGDEAQNIYDRPLEDPEKLPITPVRGKWRRLTTSYRHQGNIADFSGAFVEQFLPEIFDYLQHRRGGQRQQDSKIYYKQIASVQFESEIINLEQMLKRERAQPNNRAYLGFQKEMLRSALDVIERNIREINRCSRTFLCNAEIEQIERLCSNGTQDKEDELDQLEGSLKLNFSHSFGQPKFSTIHGYKGYESEVIILLLSDKKQNAEENIDKLFYTAITRAKKRVYILDMSNTHLSQFCKNSQFVESF